MASSSVTPSQKARITRRLSEPTPPELVELSARLERNIPEMLKFIPSLQGQTSGSIRSSPKEKETAVKSSFEPDISQMVMEYLAKLQVSSESLALKALDYSTLSKTSDPSFKLVPSPTRNSS